MKLSTVTKVETTLITADFHKQNLFLMRIMSNIYIYISQSDTGMHLQKHHAS